MQRRRTPGTKTPIYAVAALTALFLAPGCASDRSGFTSPRNLLLVTLDTLRADHLGAYGYPRATSPRLDAFAARAHLFEDVTCSVPTTLPSHVSIFTGLRPGDHGVRRNGVEPERDLTTIFDLLADQRGATTAAVVAAGVLAEPYLTGLGLGEVSLPARRDEFQIPGSRVTGSALAWLDRHLAAEAPAPFALWVHYYDTHEPYTPPASVFERFDHGYGGPLPRLLTTEDLVALNRGERFGPLEAADLRHVEDLYDAEIAALDAHLGRLLDAIAVRGLEDDTVVAIVADHGQSLGESGYFGHGKRLFEPIVKIPMLIRLPGQTEGRRITAPVESIDLMPTLAELFSLDAPAQLAGVSLAPALAGEQLPGRRLRAIERRRFPEDPANVGAALHGGDWKAVFYRDEDGSEWHTFGDRERGLDAAEQLDGADPRWQQLTALVARVRGGFDTDRDLEPEEVEMLRTLGYLQ